MVDTRRFLLFVAIAAASALLPSCGHNVVTPSGSLFEGTWRLVLIDGNEPLEDVRVTVVFREERLTGSAGCNSYFGSLTVRGDRLDVGVVASTRIHCDEPVMSQEQRFLADLQRSKSFRIAGRDLQLLAADGAPLLAFRLE